MKKILSIISLLFLFTATSFANLWDGRDWEEEAACFELLNEAVANDQRFKNTTLLPNWDLSSVLFDEVSSSYYDFSKYSNFWNAAVKNPKNLSNWNPNDDYYFTARRNNIGTIISWNNYILSQVSWFWRDSNFDFPLESKSWIPFGDKYRLSDNFFKEYVIYTHHIKSSSESYPLLSCGIVKVIPLWGRSFADISEWGYMTNILNGIEAQEALWGSKCSSWFEWEYTSKDNKDFYKLKANVCVQSYDESDYLKLEVISIAFDNSSKRLNEYYTHPLQVEAMRDNKNHAQWLKWIQDVFLSKLEEETCYSVIHGNVSNLPADCGGSYGPITYDFSIFSLKDYLFPVAYANRPEQIELPELSPEEEQDTWMMVHGNLPYNLYKKLESIPDESFREYMLLSILPNFEELIQHRTDNNVLLTPFEETFLSCNLTYDERLQVVKDFLEQLDPQKFSVTNIDYIDDTYGDCIIPYPDKDKLDIVVEWSFESNQLLAEKLSGNYAPAPDSPEVEAYIRKRESFLSELNNRLQAIESQFNTGDIDINQANKLRIEAQETIQSQIDALSFSDIYSQENNIIEDSLLNSSEESTDYKILVIILFLIVLWVGFIGVALYYKNKKS